MRYYPISVHFVLAMVILGSLVRALSPRWNDLHTKHSWDVVPRNWEFLGDPPGGATIDLYIALEPHDENALIHALYRVSDPEHARHVFATLCSHMYS